MKTSELVIALIDKANRAMFKANKFYFTFNDTEELDGSRILTIYFGVSRLHSHIHKVTIQKEDVIEYFDARKEWLYEEVLREIVDVTYGYMDENY